MRKAPMADGHAANLEREIVSMKTDLDRMVRERNLAVRSGRREDGRQKHLSALEAELNHLEALSRYVKTVSPAAARELATRQTLASKRFQRIKASGDPVDLSRFVTLELAPLINKSEQAAHLVASMARQADGAPLRTQGWHSSRR